MGTVASLIRQRVATRLRMATLQTFMQSLTTEPAARVADKPDASRRLAMLLRVARGCYLADSGFKAVIEPLALMHTAPLADPGSLSPSPESAVTVVVNDSAVGLVAAPLT
jgi:arylamine N-acetyltransferase